MPSRTKSVRRVEKDLASAPRAELPQDPILWNDHEYPRLQEATLGRDVGDGCHLCCLCGTENGLVHFGGDYPLKHVVCRMCNHVYCKDCDSSEIMTQVPQAYLLLQGQKSAEHNNSVGQVCPNCGLTHRTTLRKDGSMNLGVCCPCGASSGDSWVAFYICPPDRFRFDPNAAAVELRVRRTSKKVAEMSRANSRPGRMAVGLPFPPSYALTTVGSSSPSHGREDSACGLQRRDAMRAGPERRGA
jgi:hypothetical protein